MELGIDYDGGMGMSGLDGILMFISGGGVRMWVVAQLVHILGILVVHLAWGLGMSLVHVRGGTG